MAMGGSLGRQSTIGAIYCGRSSCWWCVAIVSIDKIECLSCISGIVECKQGYSIGIGGSLSLQSAIVDDRAISGGHGNSIN